MSISPTPKEIFENGELSFLQSDRFERQHFERKEAPTRAQCQKENPGKDVNATMKRKLTELQEKIQSTLGSFAMSNDPDGGLFALGIDDDGVIRGLNHLDSDELQMLMDAAHLLENAHPQTKRVDCADADGNQNFVYLFHVPFVANALVSSPDKKHKVWKRMDSRTIELGGEAIEQLKMDRGIVHFESQLFGEFTDDELDEELAERFRQAVIERQQLALATPLEDVLYKEGIIDRKEGKYFWTRAGYWLLSTNPHRRIAGAYIRIVKFEGRQTLAGQRFNPSFDRDFDGPIPRLITKTRVFLRQSAFFRTYEYRKEGSLVQEHELPPAAWEEAIVNAVVHRSYALEAQPIRVIKFADRLIVENPGSFVQPMPKSEFRVSEVPSGRSRPRNPRLMEWLRLFVDERGEKYVKQWQEGTKTIAETMRQAGKPEPVYRTNGEVTLVLENDIDALEARIAAAQLPPHNRFANLFPLLLFKQDRPYLPTREELWETQRGITSALRDALQNHNWFIDSDRFGELVAHKRQSRFPIPEIEQYVGIYPAYRFQVRSYQDQLFLCLDYGVREKNLRVLSELLHELNASALIGKRALYRQNNRWQTSITVIRQIDGEYSDLWLLAEREMIRVLNTDVLPDVDADLLKQVLQKRGVRFDLSREIKQRALSLTQGASRERAEKTVQMAGLVAEELFPLVLNGVSVSLQKNAAALNPPIFEVRENLQEPEAEFRDHHQTSNIADGLTRFGSFHQFGDAIQLVLVCTRAVESKMEALVNAIQKGSRNYRGANQTFGVRFDIGKRVITQRPEEYLKACQSVVSDLGNGKRWSFLVYAPEHNYSRGDYNAPYYQIKRFLLEVGFPSQMVKEETVNNPDWKDLNLALNIAAKSGLEPWVLNQPLAEADCFIGLSYSSIRTRQGVQRFFGYTNVFNNFGLWRFYKGNTSACSYDERDLYTADLIRQTLAEFARTLSVQNVHIHSTEKMSQRMREAIVREARTVEPDLTLHFAHINTTHPVRLYDQNVQGDGSLPRGAYVITSPHQFYLSTTGYNVAQKALGTPIMLEVNAHTEAVGRRVLPNLECIAQHLLSLTKLNWASTRYFCHEPITTKYAGDIAYLMNAFLAGRPDESFKLNPKLEKTPWFL